MSTNECQGCGQPIPMQRCYIDSDHAERHVWTTSGYCHCGAKQRCGAALARGGRCRKAAMDGDYCKRHAETMRAVARFSRDVAAGMRKRKPKRA